MFEGIGWEADLFWDILKAWPTWFKVYEGWPSFCGTYRRLGEGIWRYMRDERAVLRLIKSLGEVLEGIWKIV